MFMGTPEGTLDGAHVMLTFYDIWVRETEKLPLRFENVIRKRPMIIYYSGEGSRSNPEITLGDDSNLMLTFHDMYTKGKPSKRFQTIINEILLEDRERREGKQQCDVDHLETGDIPVGIPESHFLDSGSFTLWTQAEEYAKENKCGEWEFYETDAFWDYVDKYVAFVNKYKHGIEHYASIDVLPFRGQRKAPKGKSSHALTWRNQKALEKRGLKPVPVVHYKAPMKVLKRYLDKGYDFIGLGGLVGSTMQDSCKAWIDRCFDAICDTPDRMPKAKIHGFGVTSHRLMLAYPWHSVDSTSWTKIGAYGGILVPHKRSGEFVFDKAPYLVSVSYDSPKMKQRGQHITNLNKGEKEIAEEWLKQIDVPLGEWHFDDEGKPVCDAFGVVTRHTERRVANLLFFEELRKHIELKPFTSTRSSGFGLLE
jgi:hypothetical protein